jgi:hypothetical protein
MTNEERFNLFDTYVEGIQGLSSTIKNQLPTIARYVFEATTGEVAPAQDVTTLAGIGKCLSMLTTYASTGELPTVDDVNNVVNDVASSIQKLNDWITLTNEDSQDAIDSAEQYNIDKLWNQFNNIDLNKIEEKLNTQLTQASTAKDKETVNKGVAFRQIIANAKQLKSCLTNLDNNVQSLNMAYSNKAPLSSTNLSDLIGLKQFVFAISKYYRQNDTVPDDASERALKIVDNIHNLMEVNPKTGKPMYQRFGYLETAEAMNLMNALVENLLPNFNSSIDRLEHQLFNYKTAVKTRMLHTKNKEDWDALKELQEQYHATEHRLENLKAFMKPFNGIIDALKQIDQKINTFNSEKKRATFMTKIGQGNIANNMQSSSGYEYEGGDDYNTALNLHMDDDLTGKKKKDPGYVPLSKHLDTLHRLAQIIGNSSFSAGEGAHAQKAFRDLYNEVTQYFKRKIESNRQAYQDDVDPIDRATDLANAEEYEHILANLENEMSDIANNGPVPKQVSSDSASTNPSPKTIVMDKLRPAVDALVDSISPEDVITIINLNKAIKKSKALNPDKDYRRLAKAFFGEVGITESSLDSQKFSASTGYNYTINGVTIPLKIAYELAKNMVYYNTDPKTGRFVMSEAFTKKDGSQICTWQIIVTAGEGWNVNVEVMAHNQMLPAMQVDVYGNNTNAVLNAGFQQLM